jgi:hypothetical protein
MVRKKDGSWRPCGDYRRLNLATKHNRYPLPSILDLANKLHGCKFFSVVDLVKGYHQVPMDPADVPKTALITPFCLFEYLFMPFGLGNAAQTFQRLMDKLFRHLPFVFTYLDDHIIASRTLEEHLEHLRQFFTVLEKNGLTINPAKCTFAAATVEFLGHHVNEHGIRPLQRHVTAIEDFPQPRDVKQLQQFLGMINFYRRFLPSIARTLQPLTDALKGNPKTLEWTPAAAAAFVAAKAALVAMPSITHGIWSAQSALAVLARRASFRRRWKRSTSPLDWGWYAVVVVWVMFRSWQSEAHKAEVNCAPLSEVMTEGTPNLAIQPVKRACAQSAAVMEARGIASGHLVVLSMTVNRY